MKLHACDYTITILININCVRLCQLAWNKTKHAVTRMGDFKFRLDKF